LAVLDGGVQVVLRLREGADDVRRSFSASTRWSVLPGLASCGGGGRMEESPASATSDFFGVGATLRRKDEEGVEEMRKNEGK
jgi:hypothetical protein